MPPQPSSPGAPSPCRLRVALRGAVQGVGFRPFVFRIATELALTGWVNNSPQVVFIEVEGPRHILEQFLSRLQTDKPPRSFIQSLESSWLDPKCYPQFEIRPSDAAGATTALVLPDIATCPDCLRELFDAANRRYFYPFTNCTNCGPRFSIIEALPYDRAATSMKSFRMCPACQAEYDSPTDRRFHAQPNACPVCGPQLALWDSGDKPVLPNGPDKTPAILQATADALAAGRIVALKGLGGFQLLTAAHNQESVLRLRRLKQRDEKPFALMFPSLPSVKSICSVDPAEERALCSPESPIVLLRRLANPNPQNLPALAPALAPGNPNVGAMLPYTPLHHLLMSLVSFPVVATSGNLRDEPLCIDELEAVERLGHIADIFLVHNRPIVRHVDDSVLRIVAGRELLLRRARGFAPLPVPLAGVPDDAPPILAVGPHLKNTVALSVGSQVFVSQHIGDLETEKAFDAFRRVIGDFEKLYDAHPTILAADKHPDYLSTQFARGWQAEQPARRVVSVQHHLAHVFSCMAENELAPPVLGIAWDGTGYGDDGTIWGGEFFRVTDAASERVAHLRQFPLPGGDAAIKEPRRAALGLLYAAYGEDAFKREELLHALNFTRPELKTLSTMLRRGLNSPLTSSVGRLFDAVAALVGVRQQVRFEGQAAMELEFALEQSMTTEAYPCLLSGEVLDWKPMLDALLADIQAKVATGTIAARFHNGLINATLAVAQRVGIKAVALSGGCFQNRYLLEQAIERLHTNGFRPYWHQRVPPNDGGLSLGQVVAALRERV